MVPHSGKSTENKRLRSCTCCMCGGWQDRFPLVLARKCLEAPSRALVRSCAVSHTLSTFHTSPQHHHFRIARAHTHRYPVIAAVRALVFPHFCAGETLEDTRRISEEFRPAGVRVMVDHSVEERETAEDWVRPKPKAAHPAHPLDRVQRSRGHAWVGTVASSHPPKRVLPPRLGRSYRRQSRHTFYPTWRMCS